MIGDIAFAIYANAWLKRVGTLWLHCKLFDSHGIVSMVFNVSSIPFCLPATLLQFKIMRMYVLQNRSASNKATNCKSTNISKEQAQNGKNFYFYVFAKREKIKKKISENNNELAQKKGFLLFQKLFTKVIENGREIANRMSTPYILHIYIYITDMHKVCMYV